MFTDAKEWKDFEGSLYGAFSVRANGLLGSEFSLSGEKANVGVLRLEGSGARFEVGGFEGRIESSGPESLMFVGGERVLKAERDGSGATIETAGVDSLQADVSLVWNTASAHSEDGGKIARVSGGVSNRRYEASFEEGSLLVAIFLLFHLASLRSRAFRAGAAAR